jgi:hypothetical protein
MQAAFEVLEHTVLISIFVAVMMIIVEYINVQTQGTWERAVRHSVWRQYLIAVLLGAVPGCFGSFVVVALYTHRVVTLGALLACMIVSVGDEGFVMLALFPKTWAALSGGLIVLGLAIGLAVDRFALARHLAPAGHDYELHHEDACDCFPRGQILHQLIHSTWQRAFLALVIAVFATAVLFGHIGGDETLLIKAMVVVVSAGGLFVVLTVPDHFLEEHLWHHTIGQHVPRLFLWTLGALSAMELLNHFVQAEAFIRDNRWLTLVAAAAVGLVPESGPHLIFVTLFGRGAVPLSVLVTSSIIQDGHGMLPLLADSWRDVLRLKALKLAIGLGVGAALMALGQ